MKTVSIIGGGNLGNAIANGLVNSHIIQPKQLIVTRRKVELLKHLSKQGAQIHSDNVKAAKEADIIILCVKPYNIEGILTEIKAELKGKLLISTVSGVTLKQMHDWIGEEVSIIRSMPNTAAEVEESLTCLSGDVSEAEFSIAEQLFQAIGKTIRIQESLMEAATVLGACGIAYVLRFMRAMVQGGIQIGFDAQTATEIVNQTVLGAAKLLDDTNSHPEREIDKVTTPKGCTIAGLNEMEHNGFSSALIKGITKSFDEI